MNKKLKKPFKTLKIHEHKKIKEPFKKGSFIINCVQDLLYDTKRSNENNEESSDDRNDSTSYKTI